MVTFPKSKINLGLRITGKREDGYHDIETIFYPVGLCDALEIVLNLGGNEDHLTVTGINSTDLSQDNMVLTAVRKLRGLFDLPSLKIHLHKMIPSGAGLGGGSSDAASTIRLINRFFDLSMNSSEMREIALTIGSDCPFFIDSTPSYATGRGERLQSVEVSMDKMHIVLLNRGISVSTREAYSRCVPGIPAIKLTDAVRKPIYEWNEALINDFEKTVFSRYPEIKALRDGLYKAGAAFSSMSGSGSTVYGIFSQRPELGEDLNKYLIFEGQL